MTFKNYLKTYRKFAVLLVLALWSNLVFSQNNALHFDGSNDYVDLGNIDFISTGTAGQFTIEMWAKLDAYSSGYSRIFSDEVSGNHGFFLEINPSGYLESYQPSLGRVASTFQMPLNTWTHLAFVQDANNLSLYVNGVFHSVLLSGSNLYQETSNTTYIGTFPGGGRYFQGSLDELRIWNITRTSTQIQNSMNSQMLGNESGLYIYYNFNQGVADGSNAGVTSLLDATSNAKNGTLNNFSLTGTTSNWVAGANVSSGSGSNSGNALHFDGSNDYVALGSSITNLGKSDFTLEAWVKTTAVSCGIINCSNGNTSWEPGEKVFYLNSSGKPTFVGWGNEYINCNVAVNDGQWHHIAVT